MVSLYNNEVKNLTRLFFNEENADITQLVYKAYSQEAKTIQQE